MTGVTDCTFVLCPVSLCNRNQTYLSLSQWPYARPSKIRRILGNSGHLLTPEKQNLDILSTFYGRKYGRLEWRNPKPCTPFSNRISWFPILLSISSHFYPERRQMLRLFIPFFSDVDRQGLHAAYLYFGLSTTHLNYTTNLTTSHDILTLKFLQARCPSCHPTNTSKATKAK